MATKTNQDPNKDIKENFNLQEKLSEKDLNLIDDSDKLKENRNPIDTDTATNSPTKGMLDIADELISGADYTPSDKQKEKIEEKAKKKAQGQSGLTDEQFNKTLNYQPLEEPENYDLVKAAEARLARANTYDAGYKRNTPEWEAAKKAENEALSKISRAPDSMSQDEAEEILAKYRAEADEYQAKVDEYKAIEAKKNETMSHLREQFQTQLNKIIDDDTKSWTERKKLIDKTGLLFSHVMQNIGAMMHNAVNPTDWITASDPITLRAGQNLANTIKNRQTNNDTYIENQVEYWKNALPAYYDLAKIKQRLGNSRIINIYKRLDAAAQKMIMTLATSDAWDTLSGNSIITFMDKLQNGEFASPEQMWTGLAMSILFSNDENKKVIIDQILSLVPDSIKKYVQDKIDLANTVNNLQQTSNNIRKGYNEMGITKLNDKGEKAKKEFDAETEKLLKALGD